jgi:hypothetical protein
MRSRSSDPRFAVEAQASPVAHHVSHQHGRPRIRAHSGLGLGASALPPREMVGVPDHEAALQRDVGLAIIRRRDHAGALTAVAVGPGVVDDLGELREVDRGDGRGGGHRRRR